LRPIPIFDEPSLLEFLNDNGFKPVHATTIWQELLSGKYEQLSDLAQLASIPRKLVPLLMSEFALTTSKILKVQHAKDGQTTKLLIQLQDGYNIETVLMHFGSNEAPDTKDVKRRNNTHKRSTICVSSQVGCRMGCKFCATGTMGLRGHLLAGEILEQLYHARKHSLHSIRNVVFMGMGEPLDNFDSVLAAVRAMSDPRRFGLAPSRITISTVGVIPYMKKLRSEFPQVQLALSLHAPTQELRAKIVPTAKAYPLDKLMLALDEHLTDPNINYTNSRKLMIEYVVIKNVNDSDKCANELVSLLKPRCGPNGRRIVVNLIPYNPTDVPEDYRAPDTERVKRFHAILRDAGILTTVRFEKGQDIDGACGQLVVRAEKKNQCQKGSEVEDIEDIANGVLRQGSSGPSRSILTKEDSRLKTKTANKRNSRNGWIPYAAFWLYVAVLTAAVASYLWD